MAAYSPDRPVSPLKNTAWRGPRTTIDDHSVALRLLSVRPLKCCEGAAVIVRPVFGTAKVSHQSSSWMRSGAMPQPCRCAPTPSEVTKGTPVRASTLMVG